MPSAGSKSRKIERWPCSFRRSRTSAATSLSRLEWLMKMELIQ